MLLYMEDRPPRWTPKAACCSRWRIDLHSEPLEPHAALDGGYTSKPYTDDLLLFLTCWFWTVVVDLLSLTCWCWTVVVDMWTCCCWPVVVAVVVQGKRAACLATRTRTGCGRSSSACPPGSASSSVCGATETPSGPSPTWPTQGSTLPPSSWSSSPPCTALTKVWCCH